MMNQIKMLVMDVDGTLTDGKIYYGNDGEVFKAFDVRDGYRLIKCEQYGIITAIITGKSSRIVEGRAKDLKIREVYQGVSNKLEVLKTLTEKYKQAKSASIKPKKEQVKQSHKMVTQKEKTKFLFFWIFILVSAVISLILLIVMTILVNI